MVMHGLWIQQCGLSALRVGALYVSGRLYPVCSLANSVIYSYLVLFTYSAYTPDG
jgi:hypothetical protein